jgi:hypothetical protein
MTGEHERADPDRSDASIHLELIGWYQAEKALRRDVGQESPGVV